MKKMRIHILTVIVLFLSMLIGCSSNGNVKTAIKLNEATHTVFYAPLYVAMEKGYFKEEGIKINLISESGSDHTMKALLDGECNIGLLGPEATIYAYSAGTKDYAVNFAQLTQRAGNFLVARDTAAKFSWNNLKGGTVLGGREDSMPEMVFEYILKKHGIDPKTDLTVIKDIGFGKTSDSFSSGKGDYTMEFEPTASKLQKNGIGMVVVSLGEESGKIPYTAFAAKKSFLTKNPKLIQSFTDAVQKGLSYVLCHTPDETAKIIQPQFADTDMETLTGMITVYYEQDTWKDNLIFEENGMTLLQDIMADEGQLSTRVPYENIVSNKFADK